jgi:cardiolipin synthase A/B
LETAVLYVVAGVALGVVVVVAFMFFAATAPAEHIELSEKVPTVHDPAFLDLVALSADVRFGGGNRVELLLDGGQTYPRLFQELGEARRSVTIQLYFCAPGRLADRLAEALMERARAGVRVLYLHDAFGSDLPDSYLERLRESGVEAHTFRPVRWWTLHKAQERSHSRSVVIDGEVGYTGGFGIDDRWSAAGTEDEHGWRDTNVRFTGPAVNSLQAAFAAAWAETVGELLAGDAFYPGLEAGDLGIAFPRAGAPAPTIAGVIHSRPDVGSSSAERLLALTIGGATKTIDIANAYFVPGPEFRELLTIAARRGVRVRLLTPSANTDIPVVRYAGRALFPQLLSAGVRIFEYQPAMMHAKTIVVDGVWSVIGTLNFDNRSLAMNEETSLLVHDRAIGAALETVFQEDLERAVEITPERFARRGAAERLKERVAVAGARLL